MLVPRDPFEALVPLREAMNRLLEESFVGSRFEFLTGRTFPVDIYETDDRQYYVVEAALPGFKPDEVQITATNDRLTIRVAKQHEEKVQKGTYVRHERYEGEMSRTLVLPSAFDEAKVQATYEHGMLTLRIPKAQVTSPKQIPIQVKEAANTH